MSQQVANNSRIMEENLRLKEEVELEKSKVVIFPTVPTVLSSSTLVDRPTLDSQYR
uniref:Predicted protein n=1 Tax=Hordeum vulgare subsp. vulgare TaxID=112509 RepID=F2DK51_HORVV|nr:predicted protein [Hordeum vulgare subsp. vulgare]